MFVNVENLFIVNYKSKQKFLKILVEEHNFGKVADSLPEILSKKKTPLQVYFNLSVYVLGAPTSK